MELVRRSNFFKNLEEKNDLFLSLASKESGPNVNVKKFLKNMNLSSEEIIKNFIIINFLKSNTTLKDFMYDLEKNIIQCALLISMGHQRNTASLLGIKATALCEKIKKYKIKNIKSHNSYLDKDLLGELMTVFYGIDTK